MPDSIVSRYIVVFLDDIFSIDYFGLYLPPYWRYAHGNSSLLMLQQAKKDYESLQALCGAFDEFVASESQRVGGLQYAFLTSLAYRQVSHLITQ